MTNATERSIKVGLVGLGFAGTQLHLPQLKINQRAVITYVCDENPAKLEQFKLANKAIDCRTATDWKELVASKDVDAVIIATPTPSHLPISQYALEKGKHVLCEKPVAGNLSDASKMLALSEKYAQQTLMIGQVLRFWDEYVKAHNLVKSGKIGEPRVARTHRSVGISAPWYFDEALSGGVVQDLGLHDIDFLIWTLGPVVSVYGQGRNCLGNGSATFTDYAQVHLNFKSGAIAHLETSWAVPPGYPFTTSLEICGTKGVLEFDNSERSNTSTIFLSGEKQQAAPAEFNGYFWEDDAFLRAVQEGKGHSPVSVADVLHPLEVMLCARESILIRDEVFIAASNKIEAVL